MSELQQLRDKKKSRIKTQFFKLKTGIELSQAKCSAQLGKNLSQVVSQLGYKWTKGNPAQRSLTRTIALKEKKQNLVLQRPAAVKGTIKVVLCWLGWQIWWLLTPTIAIYTNHNDRYLFKDISNTQNLCWRAKLYSFDPQPYLPKPNFLSLLLLYLVNFLVDQTLDLGYYLDLIECPIFAQLSLLMYLSICIWVVLLCQDTMLAGLVAAKMFRLFSSRKTLKYANKNSLQCVYSLRFFLEKIESIFLFSSCCFSSWEDQVSFHQSSWEDRVSF